MSNKSPMLLVCSAFHGGLFFTLSLRRIFHLVQIKSKAFHVFYTAVLWFKVCIRFCSVGILCFHGRILCLSYNSIFKQWLLSGDYARIRGLMSLGPQKKRVRACAWQIFTLKMVQSSLTKSKGERSRGTDPLAVEHVWPFFPPHRMSYLAIERDLIFWKLREGDGSCGVKVGCKWLWNQEAAFTSWRCGGNMLAKQAGGWSGHLWWNVCSDQHKR